MINQIISKRYADAYIAYTRSTCGKDKAFEDFKQIKTVMREHPEFMEFLHNPEITLTEKGEFIDKVLGDDFAKEFGHFLKLLLDKRRITQLPDIAEYIRVKYSRGEETEALLKTTYPLDLETIKKIKDKLEGVLGKKLKFYIDLDGDLLGGIKVIIGNTIIDGSVKRRLEDLREKLNTIRI